VDALPKGYPQEEQMGLEKPQRVAHFRALRPSSWPRSQRAGYRRLESWSVFERMGEEHTYPIRSQLAKVEHCEESLWPAAVDFANRSNVVRIMCYDGCGANHS
jgi:hypothetical protein